MQVKTKLEQNHKYPTSFVTCHTSTYNISPSSTPAEDRNVVGATIFSISYEDFVKYLINFKLNKKQYSNLRI